MYKELRERVAAYSEQVSVQSIDERLEPALVTLARSGLPARPIQLDLSGVQWGGAAAHGIGRVAVQDDGIERDAHLAECPCCI